MILANRVVVTGVGVVSPLGLDAGSTWKNLLGGKSGVDHGVDGVAAATTDADYLDLGAELLLLLELDHLTPPG